MVSRKIWFLMLIMHLFLGSVYCGCKVSLIPVLQIRKDNWDKIGIIFYITA